MNSGSKISPQEDPAVLAQQASELLDINGVIASMPRTALEEDIRRAYKIVAADFIRIDALKQKKMEIPYVDIFSGQLHDKIAAITFLVKHKLLDIAVSSAEALEILDARYDLSNYVEALFRLRAVEAFGILFDFAAQQGEVSNPQLWQKICLNYLHLIARMKDVRPRAISFLKDRPLARRLVEQLMGAADPAIAVDFRGLGEEYVRSRKEADPNAPSLPPPTYVKVYQGYNQNMPDERIIGLSSLLVAEDRIKRAVESGDFNAVVRWVSDGSPRAIRAAFSIARASLPTSGYANLLEMVLLRVDLPVLTLAAAVVELGEVNRALRPEGGEEEINHILVDFTRVTEKHLVGVAQLTVRELRSVTAFNDVLTVIEQSGLIETAEEGVRMMCEMRRLNMAENAVLRRPVLNTAYKVAQKYLQEVQELLNSAWGARTEEMAHVYMERLKSMRAIPELEQLGLKHKHISALAKKTLAELRMEESISRRL